MVWTTQRRKVAPGTMTITLRDTLLALCRGLAGLMRLAPFAVRRGAARLFFTVESRIGNSDAALRRLFALADDIDRLIAERATAYGGGVNPKHRLTGYHDFFVKRIPVGARVLDIGCGIGEVARSIAAGVPGAQIVGIDSDPAILAKARLRTNPTNLTLTEGRVPDVLPAGPWDILVLSNVLEHVEGRVAFLKTLVAATKAGTLLLRVPLFERHWHMPLRRELGVDFRSDPTHTIEYSLAEFEAETAEAGLKIAERITLWGEIWAVLEPAR